MKEYNFNKRLLACLMVFLPPVLLFAQSWVIDEASKDNSGGIFSGVLGGLLLLGVIWVIGYVIDKSQEEKKIRERRNTRQNNNTSQTHRGVQQIPHKSQMEDKIILMLRYDGLEDVQCNTKSSEVQQPSIEDISFIQKEKENYELTKILQVEEETASKNWGKPENKEYESWYDGEALYSVDGKKIIDFEDRTEGHPMKDSVEIICDNAFGRMPNSWKGPFPPYLKVLGNCLYSYDCDSVFIIPRSVEIITGNPFAHCIGGNIDCMSPHFTYDDNGVLYDKERKKVISVMWYYEIENDKIHIATTVIMIERFSFYSVLLGKNKTLVLPSSILYIGDSAFKASWLNVVLSWGTIEIGDSAFEESHITNIGMPTSITKVGIAAFAHCRLLESVILSPNIEVLAYRTFEECDKLNHVRIPQGVKVIKRNCFCKCKSLDEVWLPNSLDKIETGAFQGCPLDVVVLSRNTIVENEAFPSTCKILYRN